MRPNNVNSSHILLLVLLTGVLVSDRCTAYFGISTAGSDDDCFCQLEGKIDECTCNIDTVDHFNNIKIYPRLQSLLQKEYFRFFKVNLKRDCPFWTDDSRCAIRYCHVESCTDEDIPEGLRGFTNKNNHHVEELTTDRYRRDLNEQCVKDDDHNSDLHFLNKTLSVKTREDIVLWAAYDNAQDNFCDIGENDEDAEYVDLLLNPERYTGYKGESARRIWHSIYMENCFRPNSIITSNPYIQSSKLNNMCLEERVFYRVISGLHASINIHLCAKYLLSDHSGFSLADPKGEWGPNVAEFQRRFSSETTNGEGPNWLRNLYFVYLLELRALAKVAPYLEKEEFYTGNEAEDWDTQMAVKDLLNVVKMFPAHFDESTMFTRENKEELKYQFKEHFRNVSRIMDCVGCDKCKLWGKLQTQGLGTALKILFSGRFDTTENGGKVPNKDFHLLRNELVALVNAFGRLSDSVFILDDFRDRLKN